MRLRRSGQGQAPASALNRLFRHRDGTATAPPRLPIDDDGQLPDQLGDAISVDKQLGEVVLDDDREISRSGVKLIRFGVRETNTERSPCTGTFVRASPLMGWCSLHSELPLSSVSKSIAGRSSGGSAGGPTSNPEYAAIITS